MGLSGRTAMFVRTLFAILAVSAWQTLAQAQDCDSAASPIEMNRCARVAFEMADRQLNQTYQELMTGYKLFDAEQKAQHTESESAADALLATQRAWIVFRDAECKLSGIATQFGSINPMIISMCLTRVTEDRVASLRKLLACEEGDVACIRIGPDEE
jgi:uncharacterized protein YecT (DUF1311 family)